MGFEVPITGPTHTPALLVKLWFRRDRAIFNGGPVGPEGSLLCLAFFLIASAWLLWRHFFRHPARRQVRHPASVGQHDRHHAGGAAPPERRYDLDWLRIIAFGATDFLPRGMYYVTWTFTSRAHTHPTPSSR